MRRGAIVTREHPHLETERLELLHGFAGFERVSHRDDSGRFARDGEEHRCGAALGQLLRALDESVQVDPIALHQRPIAQQEVATFDSDLHALASNRLEVLRAWQVEAELVCTSDDRLGERMLGTHFCGRCKA